MTTTRPFAMAEYQVEPSTLRVRRGEETVRLEPKAMKVLVYLAENAGRVVSREELERQIWPGRVVSEDALTNSITKLRRALGDDAHDPVLIETLPKTGYRLIVPVSFESARAVVPGAATTAAEPAAHSGRRVRPLVVLAGTVLLALGAMVIVLWQKAPAPVATGNSATQQERRPAVVVLPFRNLNDPAGQDYFSDGLTADLVTDLSRVSGLLLIAPQSAFAFGDSASDREIAEVLQVDFIVHGSVQRSDSRVRINARLVDTADGSVLWAQRFDREIADIFRIQDEVTAGIVEAMRVRIAPDEKERIASRSTTSIAAYEAFLRGLDLYGHRSPDDNESALRHFEHAIRLDPRFARALAGLALVYSRRAMDGWSAAPKRDLERALEFVDEASSIEPNLLQAHFARAQVELFLGNHYQAAQAIEQALAVAPNYADAQALRAWVLHYAGRSEEALAALDRAATHNPRMPASYLDIRGEVFFVQGKYAEAAAALEAALQVTPTHLRAHIWLAAAQALLGNQTDAEWQVAEVLNLNPDFALSHMTVSFPFKDPRMLDQLFFGLRKAGLPG